MPRSMPAGLQTALAAEAVELVYLFELGTGGGSPDPVRICSGDGIVSFASNDWTPRPLEFDETGVEPHHEAASLQLRLADADGYWKTLQDAGALFTGERARLFRVPRSLLGAGSVEADSIRDTFIVESWERAQGAISLNLQPLLGLLELEVPLATVTRREFPGIPDVNAIA